MNIETLILLCPESKLAMCYGFAQKGFGMGAAGKGKKLKGEDSASSDEKDVSIYRRFKYSYMHVICFTNIKSGFTLHLLTTRRHVMKMYLSWDFFPSAFACLRCSRPVVLMPFEVSVLICPKKSQVGGRIQRSWQGCTL